MTPPPAEIFSRPPADKAMQSCSHSTGKTI
jgi:hypothetical protein